jgi:hypothetical protein
VHLAGAEEMIYLTTGLGVIGFFTCVFIAFYAVKILISILKKATEK